MSIKIAAFTDHIFTPSSRFRIRQYFPYLNSEKIELFDYYRKYSTETACSVDGTIRIRHSLPLIIKALVHETANISFRFNDVINSPTLFWGRAEKCFTGGFLKYLLSAISRAGLLMPRWVFLA